MKTADHKISEFTIYRLSIYKRCLEELERERIPTISSKDFAIRFGLNSAQVRKDLAYFGEFGIRGMGYPVKTLKEQILNILGLAESSLGKKTWKAIVIGAGKLGMAILQYQGFCKYGFEILAVLDADPQSSEYTVRQQADVLQTSVSLSHIDQLETIIEERQIDIAILAIPEDNAQQIADRLANAGIRAILNFVPVQLLVPPHVKVRTVDIVAELQSLTYHLNKIKNEEEK
jgi:redox-sensing transcriptional repressor